MINSVRNSFKKHRQKSGESGYSIRASIGSPFRGGRTTRPVGGDSFAPISETLAKREDQAEIVRSTTLEGDRPEQPTQDETSFVRSRLG